MINFSLFCTFRHYRIVYLELPQITSDRRPVYKRSLPRIVCNRTYNNRKAWTASLFTSHQSPVSKAI